jgi:4-amino-4-deoxy-L-arabinose transferase-like glycosyltransferase
VNLRASWMRARWPVLVFVLALLPRLFDLGSRPFWLDEVFTFQRAALPPAALVTDSFANHHMPSYFLLLSPFIGLGDPQFWLRLPSAAFGALAVVLVYLIATRIAGWRAGLIAALILGLSPAALAFSQEARSYTLEMCLILVALYGVALLAMDIARAALPWRDPASARGAWAMFVLGSVAALDVLGDGLPWVLTANFIFLVLLWQCRARRLLGRNIITADLIITLLSLPFYIIMALKQSNRFTDSVMWIPSLNLSRLWYNIGSVYMMRIMDSVSFDLINGPMPLVLAWVIDAALILAVLVSAWRLRRRPALLATLGLSFGLLPVLFTLISIWRPILLPRYILWSAAPFAILAGIGASYIISLLPRRWQTGALAATAFLLLLNMAPYYGQETKPRWDIAAKLLAQDVAPGDVVFLNDQGALPILKLYLPAGAQAVVLADSAGDFTHAQQAQKQGKRVWAVFGQAGQTAEKNRWAKFYNKMAPLGTPQQIQVAGKRIYISLFVPQNNVLAQNCTPPGMGAGPHNAAPASAPPNSCG